MGSNLRITAARSCPQSLRISVDVQTAADARNSSAELGRWPSTDPPSGPCCSSRCSRPTGLDGYRAGRALGVSARTVRHDVDRLRALGYPVDATPGAAGGYRLAAGAHLRRCCSTTTRRWRSRSGLRTAAGASIDGIEETAVRALAKLEQVLPDRLRRACTRCTPTSSRCSGAAADRRSTPTRSRCSRWRAATASRCASTTADATATSRAAGRAAPARVRRAPVVPRRVGRPPRRLAHVPARPPRAARASRACAARARELPGWRRGRVRRRVDPHRCRMPVLGAARGRRARADAVRAALRWGDAEVEALGTGRLAGPHRGRERPTRSFRVVTWLAGSYPVVGRARPDELAAHVDAAGGAACGGDGRVSA